MAIREHKPEILGMSCLMTATMIGMKDVISALKETGLRNTVKVIVGGCPVSHEFASQIGADYY
ncbi:MAG: cobalamin-dependent protein, partial [Dehalococcoidales bacterium]|nr:cobalamin-dependent protein [Dehalococcoidales bacterium]